MTSLKPTVEKVEWQGEDVLVKINPDGNCFFGASTTGVLLWAVSQPSSQAIRGVFKRFRAAIESSGSIAYLAMPEERKVNILYVNARTVVSWYICLPWSYLFRVSKTTDRRSAPN